MLRNKCRQLILEKSAEEKGIDCIFNSILKEAKNPENWTYRYASVVGIIFKHKSKDIEILYANESYANLYKHSILNTHQNGELGKVFYNILRAIQEKEKAAKQKQSLEELYKIFPECK